MRSRLVIIALFPILIFLWMIGWSLYCTGSRKEPQQAKGTSDKDPVDITIAINEEYEECPE